MSETRAAPQIDDFSKIETVTEVCPHCEKPFRKRSLDFRVFCESCYGILVSGEVAQELAHLRSENSFLRRRVSHLEASRAVSLQA